MKNFSITYHLRVDFSDPGQLLTESVKADTIQEAMKKLHNKIYRKYRGNRVFTIDSFKLI